MRGIVAPAGNIKLLSGGAEFRGGISAAEIRYYIFYWDKVIIPASRIMYAVIEDEELLLQTGVIERPRTKTGLGRISGDNIANLIISEQASIAKTIMEENPDAEWILHQFNSEIILPPEFCVELQTIKFELINALPVPNSNVPIVEILDFKNRRATELSNVHKLLDELFIEIINDPEPTEKKAACIKRLVESISDLNNVADEKWKVTLKNDLAVELNWSALFAGITSTSAVAALAAQYLPPLQTALATSVPAIKYLADVIKVTTKATKSFEPAKNNTKLAYLSKAKVENILSPDAKNRFGMMHMSRDSSVQERSRQDTGEFQPANVVERKPSSN